jgi:hypothetical protein
MFVYFIIWGLKLFLATEIFQGQGSLNTLKLLYTLLFQFEKRNGSSRMDVVHDAIQVANIADLVCTIVLHLTKYELICPDYCHYLCMLRMLLYHNISLLCATFYNIRIPMNA